MEQSITLMTAKIHFIEDRLSLVHIPLAEYGHYVQPILQLLYPGAESVPRSNDVAGRSMLVEESWVNEHPFLNLSINPIECSVVCSSTLAQKLFAPIISSRNRRPGVAPSNATIFSGDLIAIQVDGEGLNAGRRVLELSSPLALAGISIFFITTYFSDYILVPAKSRGQVIHALEERGFVFEQNTDAYINPSAHTRNVSSTSSFEATSPSTPPPSTVDELQIRISNLFKRRNIYPRVDDNLRLIQCAGRRANPESRLVDELRLQFGLVKCLIHEPRFLSLTLTDTEPASLLLEQSLLPNFGSGDVLLGSKEDYLIPIMLDLEPLPLDSTGIICGVAGKLMGVTAEKEFAGAIDMRYLSTARAGTVMVEEMDLETAMEALRVGKDGIDI